MSLNLLRSGHSSSCISTRPQQAEAGPQGCSSEASSLTSLAFYLSPIVSLSNCLPDIRVKGQLPVFCICAIAFLIMELGGREIFLVMMSLENVEEIKEAKGGYMLRGSQGQQASQGV